MAEEIEAEREDPIAAAAHARTHPRVVVRDCDHSLPLVCRCEPPHHLRCDWMRGGDRCLRGASHLGRPHAYAPEELRMQGR